MSNNKRLQQGLMGLLAVLMVGGMAYQFTPALQGRSAGNAQGATALKVNGEPIYTRDLEAIKNNDPVISSTSTGVLGDDFKLVAVSRAVQQQLLVNASKDVQVSRADVDAEVKKIRESNQLTDNKKWTDALQRIGMTDSSFRQQKRKELAGQRKVEEIKKAVPAPTDAELRAFYDLNKGQLKTDPQIVGREIVVADKAKAESLLRQVKAGGDFAALAQANSTAADKTRGGALGPLENGRPKPVTRVLLPSDVATAAFALTGGGVTEVIPSGGKFYIVKVEEFLAPRTKTFEEARTDLVSTVTEQKKNAAVQAWVDSSTRNPQVEVVDPAWKVSDPVVGSVEGHDIKYSEVLTGVYNDPQMAQLFQQLPPEQVTGLLSGAKTDALKRTMQVYAAPTIAKNLGLNVVGRREDLLNAVMTYGVRDVKVTDADIQQFYTGNVKQFAVPGSANLDEASFKDRNQAAAFRADWNGAGDFTTAASKAGGTVSERGQIAEGDQKLDPKLSAAVFSGALRSAGEGSLTEVVQVGNRYSVGYVTDLKKPTTQPLSAVRGQIEQNLLQQKQLEGAKSFMDRQMAGIKTVDNLKTVLAEQAKRVAAEEKVAGTGTSGTDAAATPTPGATPATPTTK